mmetsp:Transcript_18839/g.30416  ORF Transcript_18839/g.30416 Transcript_18839/m.30416 type:complete len:107 (+) Transcript_18839:148-468(+)
MSEKDGGVGGVDGGMGGSVGSGGGGDGSVSGNGGVVGGSGGSVDGSMGGCGGSLTLVGVWSSARPGLLPRVTRPGEYVTQTYSPPVVNSASLRLLLAISANEGYHV